MGDTKTKTKAAMLNELESIKGLLLEEDDIPILQEVIEQQTTLASSSFSAPQASYAKQAAKSFTEAKTIFEEQQDFFNPPTELAVHQAIASADVAAADELLDTLADLEKQTQEVTATKLFHEVQKATPSRPNLAKATGENPFLPEHIRARLHGNNPPPLFAHETARKIANTSIPTRQLGNTSASFNLVKSHNTQEDIIDSIIEKMLPDIEKELRSRLELMSKNILDELNK